VDFPAEGGRGVSACDFRSSSICRKQLLCLRKRKLQVTTDSRHGFRVYPNLTRKFVPSARNQLWVADITYIRLAEEFVYLAVVLDAYSRLVIGWAVERTLEAKLAVGALQMALDKRGAPAGLIHHSDRVAQYACGEYTQLLQDRGIQISMSRKGNPYDNAETAAAVASVKGSRQKEAESFMKTLKYEEVHRVEYLDLAEVRRGMRTFLERTYNQEAAAFGIGLPAPGGVRWPRAKRQGSGMSFPGIGRSANPRGTARRTGSMTASRWSAPSPAQSVHREVRTERSRLDESSTGYPSTSCAPAELASVSPAIAIRLNLNLTVQCFFGWIANSV
jgi:transposase InsO family protein